VGAWDDPDSDGNYNDDEYDDIDYSDPWGGETAENSDFLTLDYARIRSRQTETEIRNEEIHKWLRGQDT
jgi:hypothetical protein